MALEVVSVNKSGKIVLRNKESKTTYTLKNDLGHIAHAHCITSHGSQGKTVDEIFIAQPAATFPATDSKQFYVSVSRGRDAVHIYTDDKEALLDHVSRMGDRQSALELLGEHNKHLEHVQQRQRQNYRSKPVVHEPTKSAPLLDYNKDIDYEP